MPTAVAVLIPLTATGVVAGGQVVFSAFTLAPDGDGRVILAASGGGDSETAFQIGAARVDTKTFQIKRGKVTEELTAKELKLLQLFHAYPGEVLSRDRLLNQVWGYNYYGTTRTLDQVIVQLRKKLGDNGSEPKHLITVHGVGYKLIL